MLIDKLHVMAVTSDNKLLLCNCEPSHEKVYIYKDCKTYEDQIPFTSRPYCITVVPCTDKAVVKCLLFVFVKLKITHY
jgi:hypothetical protein